MSKQKKKPSTSRRKNRPRHLRSVPSNQSGSSIDEALTRAFKAPLDSRSSTAFLTYVATMVESAMSPVHPDSPEPPAPDLGEFIQILMSVSNRESTAALYVIDALSPTEDLHTILASELATRRQPVPLWLTHLRGASIAAVAAATDEFGDGTNYGIEVRIPHGEPLTVVVGVDHTLSDSVIEVGAYPISTDQFSSIADEDADLRAVPIEPATARAWIERGIERWAMLYPPIETDTWPAYRVLLDWVLRLLPEGGVAPEGLDATDRDLDEIVDRFVASPHHVQVPGLDVRDVARTLAWLAQPEPTRWSPSVVAEILLDRLPRKVVTHVQELTQYPQVMRAFVRFCHEERGLSARATDLTIGTIDELEAEFVASLGRGAHDNPSSQLSNILRTALEDGRDLEEVAGALVGRSLDDLVMDGPVDLSLLDDDPYADWTSADFALAHLDGAVGGRAALLALTDHPLPDEPLDLAGVDEDIAPTVLEYAAACDRAADAILDIEHRTAMRRFLARAAAQDPAIFRRRSAVNKGAAAVAWVIAKANGTIGGYSPSLGVAELLDEFGVRGSVSQRAEPLLRANGVDPSRQYGGMDLNTTDLLVSSRRAELMRIRDRHLAD